jgi:hypothetical protein
METVPTIIAVAFLLWKVASLEKRIDKLENPPSTKQPEREK